MAIAFRAATQNAVVTAGITLTTPVGVVSGDVLYASLQTDGSALSPPAGWTLLKTQADTTAPFTARLYRLVAGGSEPANYTWTRTGGGYVNGNIIAFSGADATAVEDVTPTSQDNTSASSSTVTCPSITPTHTNDMQIDFCLSFANGNYSAAPGGWTKATGSDDANGDCIFYKQLSTSGATGTQAFTAGGLASSVGFTVALLTASSGIVSGGGTTESNSVVALNGAQILDTAAIQANSAVAESAQLVESTTVQANSVLAQTTAQIIESAAPGVANSLLVEAAAQILTQAAAQANSTVVLPTAQLVEPAGAIIIQANSLLVATGGLPGAGGGTIQANSTLLEASAQVRGNSLTPIANSTLVEAAAQIRAFGLTLVASSLLVAVGSSITPGTTTPAIAGGVAFLDAVGGSVSVGAIPQTQQTTIGPIAGGGMILETA